MARIDREYHILADTILREGYTYEDPNRNGVLRTEIPSFTFRHEFKDGFPLLTTRALNYKNIIVELLWFLKGDTNIQYLIDHGCNIWNKDAYKYYLKMNDTELEGMSFRDFTSLLRDSNYNGVSWFTNGYVLGDLGPVYGAQWRNSNGVDQIKNLIKGLKEKPLGTEHIVMAWNPKDKPDMALPPCHYGFQVVVRPLSFNERAKMVDEAYAAKATIKFGDVKHFLEKFTEENIPKYGFEIHWSQRSVDTFLGLPYNIASYASLALILEKITGYKALGIQGDLKKVHLYENSLNPIREQLKNDPYKIPKCELYLKDEFHYITDKSLSGEVSLNKIIEEMKPEWFKPHGYESYPEINVTMLERDR